MRHRTTRTVMAAALLMIAAAAGCAEDGTDQVPGSSGEATTSSSSSMPPEPRASSSPPSSPPSSSPPSSPHSASQQPSFPQPSSRPPDSPATATPGPLVEAVTWADSDYGVTLKVAPTQAGRRAAGQFDAEAAWLEVVRLAPDADTPGMWEQFDCHWTWARILEPAKPTWNIEPWRPAVTPERMLAEGCNPGGPEV